jgi:hypothetical protein
MSKGLLGGNAVTRNRYWDHTESERLLHSWGSVKNMPVRGPSKDDYAILLAVLHSGIRKPSILVAFCI